MKKLYERLVSVLSAIEPRNEDARRWLNQIIARGRTLARGNFDVVEQKKAIADMHFDFQPLLIIQGADAQQKALYVEVEALLKEIETSLLSSETNPA